METKREASILEQRYIPKIITFGLMLSCIPIIFSVDYLYQNQKWIELVATTALFATMVILIRIFKSDNMRINNEEAI